MRFWIIHAVFSVSVKNKNGAIFLQGTIKITKNKEVRFIFLCLCEQSNLTIRLLPRPYRTPRHDVSLIYCEVLQKIKNELSYPQITFSITFG